MSVIIETLRKVTRKQSEELVGLRDKVSRLEEKNKILEEENIKLKINKEMPNNIEVEEMNLFG